MHLGADASCPASEHLYFPESDGKQSLGVSKIASELIRIALRAWSASISQSVNGWLLFRSTRIFAAAECGIAVRTECWVWCCFGGFGWELPFKSAELSPLGRLIRRGDGLACCCCWMEVGMLCARFFRDRRERGVMKGGRFLGGVSMG